MKKKPKKKKPEKETIAEAMDDSSDDRGFKTNADEKLPSESFGGVN